MKLVIGVLIIGLVGRDAAGQTPKPAADRVVLVMRPPSSSSPNPLGIGISAEACEMVALHANAGFAAAPTAAGRRVTVACEPAGRDTPDWDALFAEKKLSKFGVFNIRNTEPGESRILAVARRDVCDIISDAANRGIVAGAQRSGAALNYVMFCKPENPSPAADASR